MPMPIMMAKLRPSVAGKASGGEITRSSLGISGSSKGGTDALVRRVLL